MPHFVRSLLVAAMAGLSVPAAAQLTGPVRNGDTTIIVTGTRETKGKTVEMSDWRMAETPHVIVFSRGPEKELMQTAHDLEKLHFLLSVLLNRVDAPDDTIKIAVTMIGDAAEFEQLRLNNVRWQYGPYPRAFPANIYYDPREEGPVMATSATDMKLILAPSRTRPTQRNCSADGDGPGTNESFIDTSTSDPTAAPTAASAGPDLAQFPIGELSFCQSSQARLYAGFAQNYLLTYFPAAYPRWYLQGFGELFSTIATTDSEIEYGRAPEGLRKVLEEFGNYPVDDVLDGKYLTDRRWKPDWTPHHAWRLVHLLFFSDRWRQPLNAYLAAIATGKSDAEAAKAFGDKGELRRQLAQYRGSKVPFERMTFPAERAASPSVRQLTRAEAGLVRGRLELGARIEVPPLPTGGDARSLAKAAEAQRVAIARRENWLNRLRENAQRFPERMENHLLLAEAECRSGNAAQCLAAANRTLALSPGETRANVWKAAAQMQLAAAAPAAERKAKFAAARALIVGANRADTEAILPLIAYYESFVKAGEAPSDAAVAGLMKTVDSVPAAPKPRLALGRELAERGEALEAQRTLLPVARGAFETPEQAEAEAVLRRVR